MKPGEDRGNDGRVENEENRTQVSLLSHSPWKSLRDSHIPTAPAAGYVRNLQNQNSRKEPLPADRFTLHLQAHSSMRKCYPPESLVPHHSHEAEVHMKLMMTVKQRRAGTVGDEIHLHRFHLRHDNDVLENA